MITLAVLSATTVSGALPLRPFAQVEVNASTEAFKKLLLTSCRSHCRRMFSTGTGISGNTSIVGIMMAVPGSHCCHSLKAISITIVAWEMFHVTVTMSSIGYY